MMLKERTNRWARLKLLLLVPAGFIAFSVFARPGTEETPEKTDSPSSISRNKSMEKEVITQQMVRDSIKQTTQAVVPVATKQAFSPNSIVVMINAQGMLNVIWKSSPESKVHGKVCDTDGLRSFVKEFLSDVGLGNKNAIGITLKIEMDEQTSIEKVKEVKNILREVWSEQQEVWQKQNLSLQISSNENMRSYLKGDIPECFPILLKYTSQGETKTVECNNQASLESVDLAGVRNLALYADKNCRMGFISQICSLLRQKQAQLQIEYELL